MRLRRAVPSSERTSRAEAGCASAPAGDAAAPSRERALAVEVDELVELVPLLDEERRPGRPLLARPYDAGAWVGPVASLITLLCISRIACSCGCVAIGARASCTT